MPLVGGSSSVTLYVPNGADSYIKIKLPMRSESINPRYNSVVSSEALLGNRAPVGTYVGQLTYEGTIEAELFDLTENAGVPKYKHAMLGAVLLAFFGKYDDTNKKITLSSNAPTIAAVEINHGGSVLTYVDAVLTSLRFSFTTDGMPTVSMDLRAKGVGTAPTANIVDFSNLTYSNPYTAKNIAIKVGSSVVTDKVSRFEVNFSQDVVDYFTFGSFNARDIKPSRVGMAEVTIEYYPNVVASIDLSSSLNTAFVNGTACADDIIVEISSPIKSTETAVMKFSRAFVTEYTHDINGPEFISSTLGLQVSPANIEITGIDLTPAA